MKKIKVGILFGGKSGEHEVSLQSAKSVYEALDKNKYDVVLIGIDKRGNWLLSDASQYLLNDRDPKLIKLNEAHAIRVTAISEKGTPSLVQIDTNTNHGQVDVFLPILHGTYGEDGSIQGLFELLDVAYAGSGVLGSAIGMDKDVMKRLLNQAGIPTARFVSFKKSEASNEKLNNIIEMLGLPVFVKPACLGSSVGVTKVMKKEELKKALDLAFLYDVKAVVEEAIEGREIECAVLGNDHPKASIAGEVIVQAEFYSYDAKYIDENGAVLKIPADLTPEELTKVQEMAIHTFKVLESSGMARVDFFLKKDGTLVLNEINTIPGFTKISMYPKLWKESGLPYNKLLDELIELSLERKKEKEALKRSYD